MRKSLLALLLGVAAFVAAACGTTGSTTSPGVDTESMSPVESEMAPVESLPAESPASS